MSLRLNSFDASNLTDGKNQVVDILIEGEENQIAAIKKFVKNNQTHMNILLMQERWKPNIVANPLICLIWAVKAVRCLGT